MDTRMSIAPRACGALTLGAAAAEKGRYFGAAVEANHITPVMTSRALARPRRPATATR